MQGDVIQLKCFYKTMGIDTVTFVSCLKLIINFKIHSSETFREDWPQEMKCVYRSFSTIQNCQA